MSEGWRYFLDFKGQSFELQDGEVAVGRSRTCEVSVDDPSVSRRHVVLKADSGRILLKDLGSSNGTFINGDRVQDSGELHHEDTLGLGDADVAVRVVGTSAFETVRMSAHPLEKPHGDATLFLQQASAKLAQEAMNVGQEAPGAPQPAAPSHMAPPPIQPQEEAPTELSEPVAPQPAAPQPVAPQPVAPQPVAPQPVAPPPAPVAAKLPTAPVPTASPPPAAPIPAAPSPPAAPIPAAPPPAPPEPRLDHAAGDLLPSLDGFDSTMGPEMLAALQAEAAEKPTAPLPAPNPYGSPTQQQPAAGFGIRLLAAIADWLWMVALSGTAYFMGQDIGGLVASGITLIIVLFGWAIWGTTPGKRAFKLYVSTGDGAQAGIGFPRALARLIGYVASTVPLGIGFLMIAFTASNRGLHDLIAGTHVRRQA